MTATDIKNVSIRGIATVVPQYRMDNLENKTFSAEEIKKTIASTGVKTKYITDTKTCASDLCYEAALYLCSALKIDRQEIDLIVFISQTPDYILPATACILQHRLQLAKDVMAFDINLGCSGYTYGLIVLANILKTNRFKKALLLAGDTISKRASTEDRSVAFLFGDAGSATLLEYSQKAEPIYVDFGTDGNGYDKLIVPAGGCRSPTTSETLKKKVYKGNNVRAKTELFMSGADIFTFTIDEVPKTITRCLTQAACTMSKVDFFIFHQANQFILNHLSKKLEIPIAKVPSSLAEYGNTSVASIPLTICKTYKTFSNKPQKILLCGFGVGFSWASVLLNTKNLLVFPITQYTGDK